MPNAILVHYFLLNLRHIRDLRKSLSEEKKIRSVANARHIGESAKYRDFCGIEMVKA